MSMDVRAIVRDYLVANGYDGLCGFQCGCSVDDLAPCGDYMGACKPAYIVIAYCDEAKESKWPCYSTDGCCHVEDGECPI